MTHIPPSGGEHARQRRVTDMLVSMHSDLRDTYARRATATTSAILVLTALGATAAFANGAVPLTILGLSAARATWAGFLTFGTFALVLVDLVLDHRGAESRHADAAKRLAELKARFREPYDPATAASLAQRYEEVTDEVEQIPGRSFDRLKSRHLRKVEVSRLLSQHPGLSVHGARRILRTRLAAAKRAV